MERSLDSPDGWLFSNSFLAEPIEFSGGGQGANKKPVTKIRGSQDRQRQEKVRNIPRPMPKIKLPWPFSKPKP